MSRSRKAGPASRLSESVHQQINKYALAASAAGVGVLALAQPAAAKIVYTPANVLIQGVGYDLDLNGDGVVDFTFLNSTSCETNCFADVRGIRRTLGNQIVGLVPFEAALSAGAPIGPRRHFTSSGNMADSTNGAARGPWVNVTNRYLGVKFVIQSQFHYGWARFTVSHQGQGFGAFTVTLTGYAYETVPNRPIAAGKESGGDEAVGMNLPTFRTPATQPASLGLLAGGAPALVAWRGKDEEE